MSGWSRRVRWTGAVVVAGLTFAAAAYGVVVGSHPVPTWQTNGRVNTIFVSGSVVYLGGQFTSVRPAGAAAGTGEVTRNHAAAFSLTTGALLPWNPNANGTVRAIRVAGSKVFLGGSFTQVGGHGRTRLAAVSPTSGALLSGWSASADAEVLSIVPHGTLLYLGGSFGSVDGSPRAHLAAVSQATGGLAAWRPSADGDVKSLAVTTDGTKIIAGGLFTHIGSSPQSHITALSPSTGSPLAWATHVPWTVISLATDSAGVYAAAAGGGGNFVAFNPATGAMRWQGGTNGNVQAISVVGGVVYVGGHFLTYCGPQTGQHTCTNPISRNKLLAVSETNGALLPWNPGANSVLGVFALRGVPANGDLLAGGDFTSIGARKQQGYAQFVP
jgi:PQQ-like domain